MENIRNQFSLRSLSRTELIPRAPKGDRAFTPLPLLLDPERALLPLLLNPYPASLVHAFPPRFFNRNGPHYLMMIPLSLHLDPQRVMCVDPPFKPLPLLFCPERACLLDRIRAFWAAPSAEYLPEARSRVTSAAGPLRLLRLRSPRQETQEGGWGERRGTWVRWLFACLCSSAPRVDR